MHVMNECNYSEIEEMIEDIMSEERQGIEWMNKGKKATGRRRIKGEEKQECVR